MNSQEKMNLLRQLLTAAGAVAAARGLLTTDQASALVNNILTIVPAAVSVGSIIWSVYAHWNMKKVPETATVVPSK